MSKPQGKKGGRGYKVVDYPDVPGRPAIDEREQHEVMVQAANQRGGLCVESPDMLLFQPAE